MDLCTEPDEKGVRLCHQHIHTALILEAGTTNICTTLTLEAGFVVTALPLLSIPSQPFSFTLHSWWMARSCKGKHRRALHMDAYEWLPTCVCLCVHARMCVYTCACLLCG